MHEFRPVCYQVLSEVPTCAATPGANIHAAIQPEHAHLYAEVVACFRDSSWDFEAVVIPVSGWGFGRTYRLLGQHRLARSSVHRYGSESDFMQCYRKLPPLSHTAHSSIVRVRADAFLHAERYAARRRLPHASAGVLS